MNFRTTIVLLVLVAIGAAAWLISGRGGSPTTEAEPKKGAETELRYVLDPRPETKDVTRLTVERPGQPTLVFERSDEEDPATKQKLWRMRQPVDSATESYMVDGLVGSFVGLQYRTKYAPGAKDAVSPQTAGLEPAAVTYVMVDKDGKEYKLQVGKKAALSNDTYVRGPGDVIYLCQRDFSYDLKKTVNDYRAKSLFKLSRKDVTRVRVEYADQTYELSKSGDDWVLSEPHRAYADADKVKALVNAVGNVRVAEYLEDAPASLDSFGLDKPYLSVSVTSEETRQLPATQPAGSESQPAEPKTETVTRTFALLAGAFADMESKNRYIKLADQPWVASADKQRFEEIVGALAGLRDTRLTRLKPETVTTIELHYGDQAAKLSKVGGQWRGEGELAEADPQAVDSLVQALQDTRAIDFVEPSEALDKYGLQPPRAELHVSTSAAVEPIVVQVGAVTASGRNAYARVVGQESILVISAAQADRLAPQPLALRSRTIFDIDPERIDTARVEHAGKRYEMRRDAGGWSLVEPADAPADAERVAALVNDLGRLRAKTVAGRADVDTFGLSNPSLTIRFSVLPAPQSQPAESQPAESQPAPASEPAAPVEHVVVVNRPDDAVYLRKDDDAYVFEIDETVYNTFAAEFIRNQLFDFPPEQIVSIRIERDGKTLELIRDQDQWKYAPDLFVKLDQEKIKSLTQAICGWKVDRYVTYRDADTAESWISEAPIHLTLRLEDGSAVTLKVDRVRAGAAGQLAAWIEQKRTFRLPPGAIANIAMDIDQYVASETPKPRTPSPSPAPLPTP
ncbi:MAG: DUF4340 domain-containing protein [Phycisphaerae bacterium]|jgi:hypothetical protein